MQIGADLIEPVGDDAFPNAFEGEISELEIGHGRVDRLRLHAIFSGCGGAEPQHEAVLLLADREVAAVGAFGKC